MKDNFHIVLVEDNIGDVILAKEAFENTGITDELIVASNGQEALEILNELSNKDILPKLILLDLNMPIINGLEFLGTMRKNDRYKFIPTILLTTSSAENDIRQAYNVGANAYLVKPFDNDEFNEMIKRMVEFWLFSAETVKITG